MPPPRDQQERNGRHAERDGIGRLHADQHRSHESRQQKGGNQAGGNPDCVSLNSGGKVACFAKAYNTGVYGSLFNGGAWVVGDWAAYGALGGSVNDNAGCANQAAAQLVCGVVAIDNAFYGDVYTGSWTGWAKIGGTGVGTPPACAPLGTGQAVCVVLGIDNKLTSVVGP